MVDSFKQVAADIFTLTFNVVFTVPGWREVV